MTAEIDERLNASGLIWSAGAPLKRLCHWRIGGPADYLVEPRGAEETARALEIAADADRPCLVIGHGSNMLFDDMGYRGVVVKIGGRFGKFGFDGTSVRAQAGVWTPELARVCAGRGLGGLEHAVGIPGNLGGLIFMNGGSMRRGVGERVEYVDILDERGRTRRLSAEECCFSYRHSVFQHKNWVILGARLRLDQSDAETVRRGMLAVLAERRGKFPLDFPNCGSVFSNDDALYRQYGPPGMVIDRLGLKGTRVGDAEVSRRHANFIINRGNARSADVFELVRRIRARVLEKTGFTLKCEVRYASPEGRCDRLDAFL